MYHGVADTVDSWHIARLIHSRLDDDDRAELLPPVGRRRLVLAFGSQDKEPHEPLQALIISALVLKYVDAYVASGDETENTNSCQVNIRPDIKTWQLSLLHLLPHRYRLSSLCLKPRKRKPSFRICILPICLPSWA